MRFRFPLLFLPALASAMVHAAGDPDLDWYRQRPEPTVLPSPSKPASLRLGPSEKVKAFAVSPLAPLVVLATEDANQRLLAWDLRDPDEASDLHLPAGVRVSSLAFHPEKPLVFLALESGGNWQLVKQAFPARQWAPTVLASFKAPLGDLLVSARPFSMAGSYTGTDYRLYFSVQAPDGPVLASVRENGAGPYTMIGTPAGRAFLGASPYLAELAEGTPVYQGTDMARPVAMHPDGTEMTYRDERGCFSLLKHGGDNWGPSDTRSPTGERRAPWPAESSCEGSGEYLPNGLGWLHWLPGARGATASSRHSLARRVAVDLSFLSQPHLTADARGLVGWVAGSGGQELRYVPVQLPLGEVVNAGAFIQTQDELRLLLKHDGLLRPGVMPQMYSLYETELYASEISDTAALPYLVTTDIFWELYAAAFESMLTVTEDHAAVPAFWRMVNAADRHFKGQGGTGANTELARVFDALKALRDDRLQNPEAALLKAGAGAASTIFAQPVDFNGTTPRGFYTRSPAAETYFRAMKYLSTAPLSDSARQALKQLPAPVQQAAQAWIQSYRPFIAPARAALAWQSNWTQASYARYPLQKPSLFPLSWGFDNEVFDRLVLHTDRADPEPVRRGLPTGLDLAAVLGSDLAIQLLEPGLSSIRNYRPQLEQLRLYYQQNKNSPALTDGLYHAWLRALATQWAPKPAFPGSTTAGGLWAAKRLQTGLASWATLRHSTILVNDQAGAEAGEGGPTFEFISQRPPRGYVEPDPDTFKAIAGLFDQSLQVFDAIAASWNTPAARMMRQGYRERLIESRDEVRRFERMARKQLAGQALDDEEYSRIRYAGRSLEHNFLVFKSAQSKRRSEDEPYGLAQPEDMPKIADVASGMGERLLVAVGQPLEWQQIVPFFGRRQVVKGAIYAYHEFSQGNVMTDEAWRQRAPSQPLPPWLRDYHLRGAARQMKTSGP